MTPGQAELPDRATTLATLGEGDVRILGRLPFSSNATFLVEACAGETRLPAVYKPARGERPLRDFPPGLHRREVAAYELACQLGWDVVPPTVARQDGPLGEGSLQAFVAHDPDEHYFVLVDDPCHHDQLRRICALDLVINSADRKGGHLLLDEGGHVWAIDNGLTFHAQLKLRTVIWDFAGEAIDEQLLEDLARLVEEGPGPLITDALDPFERDALMGRAAGVIEAGTFPHDPTGMRWPYPPV